MSSLLCWLVPACGFVALATIVTPDTMRISESRFENLKDCQEARASGPEALPNRLVFQHDLPDALLREHQDATRRTTSRGLPSECSASEPFSKQAILIHQIVDRSLVEPRCTDGRCGTLKSHSLTREKGSPEVLNREGLAPQRDDAQELDRLPNRLLQQKLPIPHNRSNQPNSPTRPERRMWFPLFSRLRSLHRIRHDNPQTSPSRTDRIGIPPIRD